MEFNAEREPAWFENAKVYHDGSHFIAIPHTTNRCKKRPRTQEKVFVVSENEQDDVQEDGAVKTASILPRMELMDDDECPECPFEEEIEAYYTQKRQESITVKVDITSSVPKRERPKRHKRVTRGGEFNRLYAESKDMQMKERKRYLMKGLRRLFKDEKATEHYVDRKIMDKYRALVERRKRFTRKAYLNGFNYFVTFTYANDKHTEESFKKKLLNTLKHFANRKGWRYMGVWERGAKTERLHFHALVKIPEGTMPGQLEEVSDFNIKTHQHKKTVQNTFFNKKFGRSDFELVIQHPRAYIEAVEYILKYVSKTGERIVYSRGIPMYFSSDINSEDVLVRTGLEGKKLILHDKFGCWDEGEYLGVMSEETKQRMRPLSS